MKTRFGNIFGTTLFGGSANYGTIYEISPKRARDTLSLSGLSSVNPLISPSSDLWNKR